MQLKLNRSQRDTGVFTSKVAFGLHAKVALEEDERKALERYKFGDAIVYHKDNVTTDPSGQSIVRNLAAATLNLTITVNQLTGGRTVECKSIREMLEVEEQFKMACSGLKNLLVAAQNFEGEEVIEY